MNISKVIGTIYKELLQYTPLFRILWIGTIALGIGMLIIALLLKKDSTRKKSPWIVGGVGLLMIISSGTQLISSLL